MSGFISKSKGPTGLLPIDPEHDHWAFMVDGLVIWSGREDECRRRLNLAQEKLLRGMPLPEGTLERAIRVLA